jgi:hypothetical protein
MKKAFISWLMLPIILFAVMILLIISTTSKQNENGSSDYETVQIDTTISIQYSETATIRIENSGTTISVNGSGTTIVESSGRTITIENSRTNSKSRIRIRYSETPSPRQTIRIQGSGSRNNNWENPWDDSRWQDNKVPWLEHTQGYP